MVEVAYGAGLLIVLLGRTAGKWRVYFGGAISALALASSLAVTVNSVILPEARFRAQLRQQVLPGRTVTESDAGFTLNLPPGWDAVNPDNPVAPHKRARAFAVNLSTGAYAEVLVETNLAGVSTLDGYLDRITQNTRATESSFTEIGRMAAKMAGREARQYTAEWESQGLSFQTTRTVTKDGWIYYLLNAWSIRQTSRGAEAAEQELLKGFQITGNWIRDMALQLQKLNPLISQDIAERLAKAMAQRSPERTAGLLGECITKGKALLAPEERTELEGLYSDAFALLPKADQDRLRKYIEETQNGVSASGNAGEMDELTLKALDLLPRVRWEHCKDLINHALQAGLKVL